MSSARPPESAKKRINADGHMHLGFCPEESDSVSVCLRKLIQDDLDEDVPEEFDRLLRMLH